MLRRDPQISVLKLHTLKVQEVCEMPYLNISQKSINMSNKYNVTHVLMLGNETNKNLFGLPNNF